MEINRSNFDPTKRGSFYTVGEQNPERYIILMHGSGQNALKMEKHAKFLASILPNTQVIVPNGYVDNYDPECCKKSRAKKVGQRFDWQFWSEASFDDYSRNFETYNPFFRIMTSHVTKGIPVHIHGFSAGAYGALKEIAERPKLYASAVLQGMHIDDYNRQLLEESEQTKPEIKSLPIHVNLPALDPLVLFNTSARRTRFAERLPIVGGFANRLEAQHQHAVNIADLKVAGFNISVAPDILATHQINSSILRDTVEFITLLEALSAPYAQNLEPPSELDL